MNIGMFFLFEIVALIGFIYAMFSNKHNNNVHITTLITWVICVVLFGVLMMSSWNVEVYNYNTEFTGVTFDGFVVETTTSTWPAVGAINIMFFSLSLLFGLFDIFNYIRNIKSGDT